MNIVEGSLYRLAKKYGRDVEYYEESDLIIDEISGTATSSTLKVLIKDCIKLPSIFARNSLSQFTFDSTTTKFYIPSRNAGDLILKKGAYLNCLSCRYSILEVHEYNGDFIVEVEDFEGIFPDLQTETKFNILMMVSCNVS